MPDEASVWERGKEGGKVLLKPVAAELIDEQPGVVDEIGRVGRGRHPTSSRPSLVAVTPRYPTFSRLSAPDTCWLTWGSPR